MGWLQLHALQLQLPLPLRKKERKKWKSLNSSRRRGSPQRQISNNNNSRQSAPTASLVHWSSVFCIFRCGDRILYSVWRPKDRFPATLTLYKSLSSVISPCVQRGQQFSLKREKGTIYTNTILVTNIDLSMLLSVRQQRQERSLLAKDIELSPLELRVALLP